MKKYCFMIILLTTYSLANICEAKGQSVNSYSDVYYYEPTNSLYAYSEAYSDYPASLYYCLEVSGRVFKDGVEAAWISGHNMAPDATCGGWATA